MVALNGRKISDDAQAGDQGHQLHRLPRRGRCRGPQPTRSGSPTRRILLQVTPTDTALALTQTSSAVANSPTLYYESLKTYGRTFARVVPSDAPTGQGAGERDRRPRGQAAVRGCDGSDYGRALATAIRSDAGAASITVQHAASGADGMLYAGTSGAAAAQLFNGAGPKVRLFAPSRARRSTPRFAATPVVWRGQASGGLHAGLPAQRPVRRPRGSSSPPRSRPRTGTLPRPRRSSATRRCRPCWPCFSEPGRRPTTAALVVHDFFQIKNRAVRARQLLDRRRRRHEHRRRSCSAASRAGSSLRSRPFKRAERRKPPGMPDRREAGRARCDRCWSRSPLIAGCGSRSPASR